MAVLSSAALFSSLIIAICVPSLSYGSKVPSSCWDGCAADSCAVDCYPCSKISECTTASAEDYYTPICVANYLKILQAGGVSPKHLRKYGSDYQAALCDYVISGCSNDDSEVKKYALKLASKSYFTDETSNELYEDNIALCQAEYEKTLCLDQAACDDYGKKAACYIEAVGIPPCH